jgi:nicotinate phosphoribosyltransferase
MSDNPIVLVDTCDSVEGVRDAIAAAEATGVPLMGVRLDSKDLAELARAARRLLDDAGRADARIVASGELDERQIAGLVAAGAPIDSWGVGTELPTSRDAAALGGVYKLVDDAGGGAPGRRALWKRSPGRSTVPGRKQVFRSYRDGVMAGDLIAGVSELHPGEALLERFVEAGELVRREPLAALTQRAQRSLASLPAELRTLDPRTARGYPVTYSERLRKR